MISRDNDIANELRDIIPDAQWTALKPAYGEVPAGYFEQLPYLILQKVYAADVQEELEALSPLLAGIPKALPLSVPPDYFGQLSQQLLQNITTGTAEQAPPATDEVPSMLSDMPKVFPMSAPAGYFDQLSTAIMDRIAETDRTAASIPVSEVQEELAALSPLLAEMPKTMPLAVPAGYFDQLSTTVMASIDASAHATTPIRRINSRRYFKWAVAASLIALVSVSTLLFTRENRHTTNAIENTLANISDQEIMEYLQSHADVFDKEELASYAPLIEEGNEIPEVDELPAEAIQHYLDNTGLLNESLTDN